VCSGAPISARERRRMVAPGAGMWLVRLAAAVTVDHVEAGSRAEGCAPDHVSRTHSAAKQIQ
jgi:hypothetical protein